MRLGNYVMGSWVAGTGPAAQLSDASTGEVIAEASSGGLDFGAIAEYARRTGNPVLRNMTFHERAAMLKALALHLNAKEDEFYPLSYRTGATKGDSWIDIDGGIGTLFAYASRGRREFPNERFHVEAGTEPLAKSGKFAGRHICVPLEGVAIHINAFNFPVWGMLEKMAPALLAGVPCIVKPATATSYLTEAVFREMINSGVLPEGAVQLICGSAGDLLDHVTEQDAVAFTGSASTGRMLREGKAIVQNSTRFNMEADSLNCCILGADATPGTEEFDLFIREVAREMTVKAGQKCTAIRRTIVPAGMEADVVSALKERLARTVIGDPRAEGVRMGPLASKAQQKDVTKNAAMLRSVSEQVYGGGDFAVHGARIEDGAFYNPELLVCNDPFSVSEPHDIEAFGPVNTVMPYRNADEAIELARRGRGSLVGSVVTHSPGFARDIVLGLAPYHGRMLILDRESGADNTGHGSALPGLVHGGPGRAGGGEELGGSRGVLHYMQRTAVQGSPSMLTAVTREWSRGAATVADNVHPFRKYFDDLTIGESFLTATRSVTLEDVVRFAELSGDHFYAHMSDEDARSNGIFTGRVAHGYFVVSAAAGLFVDPAPGPVLANYGLESLRFTAPVYPGDTIQARLTVKQKTVKDTPKDTGIPQGVVEWDVQVTNQNEETVALYSILTLVRRRG